MIEQDDAHHLYEALVASVNGIVWEADARTFQFTFVSQQAERLLGYPVREWRAPGFWMDHLHGDDRAWAPEFCRQATCARRHHDFEYRMVAADGRVVWLRDIVNVVVEGGEVTRLRGIMVDVTEHRQAENRLILFRSLVDHANDAIEVLDPETGRILDVNEKACQCHGYSRAEILALAVSDLDPDLGPDAWKAYASDLRRVGSHVVEREHRRKDGSAFPVEVNAVYVQLDRDYVIAVVRDITDRKVAERALVESHSLLNTVIEGTTDAVFVKDRQGRYLMINSAGARMLGKAAGEIVGSDDRELFAADSARAIMERDRQVIEAGGSLVVEEMATAAGVTRTYLSTRSVYRDARGRVVGLIGIARDVTELKQLEAQLRQAQKMEAVGRLAGGVAHDFNNLLTVISGHCEMLAGSLGPDDARRELLVEVQKAGDRAANLTLQLLAFSRQQVLQPRVVNLNALLGDLCTLLRRLIGKDIDLTLVPWSALGLVKVDATQFEHAIINMVVNARDAMPQGGRLTIATHNVDLGAQDVTQHPEVKPGRYMVVAVGDSGHGMDEATKARIFEPFFTTKGPGKGSGLGLAMVYGFVKQSGGYIYVDSQWGRGATFRVYLPEAEEAAPTTTAEPPSELPEFPAGTETVLVVEDEDAVRHLVRRFLQMSGYTVLHAPNGEEAVSVARKHDGPIHLLVTDVAMPGMNGRQLGDVLTRARPGLRILFMSGYTDEAVLREGKLEPGTAFLQKPFNPASLVRKVRDVLDGRAG